MGRLLMLTAVLAGPFAVSAAGQSWVIEQVDSVGWGDGVSIRRCADGKLVLCYSQGSTGRVRLAWDDGPWRLEDVPHRGVPGYYGPHFAVSPAGDIAVTHPGDRSSLSLRRDSVWRHAAFPNPPDLRRLAAAVAFDSMRQPVVTVAFATYDSVMMGSFVIGLMRLADSGWVITDTVASLPVLWNPGFEVHGLGSTPDGSIWGARTETAWGMGYSSIGLYTFWQDHGWEYRRVFGGERVHLWGIAVTGDVGVGSHTTCSWQDSTRSGFFFDNQAIDPRMPQISAVGVDTCGRPLVTFSVDGAVHFRYLDHRGWHSSIVVTAGAIALDVVGAANGQPVVAYATGAGVFVARGIDVTAVERPSSVRVTEGQPQTSVVRGELRARSSHHGLQQDLLDAAGRQVLTLRAGANDVSRLAPGVYFVVETGDLGRGTGGKGQKVVIAR